MSFKKNIFNFVFRHGVLITSYRGYSTSDCVRDIGGVSVSKGLIWGVGPADAIWSPNAIGALAPG